jgi:hypothetical protein
MLIFTAVTGQLGEPSGYLAVLTDARRLRRVTIIPISTMATTAAITRMMLTVSIAQSSVIKVNCFIVGKRS